MATIVTEFPKINFHRFYPANFVPNPNLGFIQFDQTSFYDTIKPWQTREHYYQKATFQDKIVVMVNTQVNESGSGPTLNIYKEDGTLFIPLEDPNKGSQTVAGNVYTDPTTGETTDLVCSLWSYSWADFGLDPSTDSGIYYLQLNNNFDFYGLSENWESEPILLYNDQPETILFEASYDTNKNDVLINGWDGDFYPVFYHRIEADIRKYEPQGYQYSYLQQDYMQLTQQSANWRTWELRLGYQNKIPDYLIEKATYVVTADNLLIAGKWFVRKDSGNDGIGNMWEKQEDDTYPMSQASTLIRERFANENVLVSTTVSLWGTYSFPFASTPILLRSQESVNTVTIPTRIYFDSDDIVSMVDYLNSNTLDNNQYGYYTTNGQQIVYVNAPGETWYVLDAGTVLTEYLKMFTYYDGSASLVNDLNCNSGSIIIADYGNVAMFPYNLYYNTTTTPSLTNVLPAGTYTRTIFHNNRVNNFYMGGGFSAAGAYATNTNACFSSGSYFPSSTKLIQITFGLFYGGWGGFNVDIQNAVAAAQDNLETLDLNNMLLGTSTNTLFTMGNYSALNYIDLSGNCLTASDMDTMINGLYTNSTYVTTGAIMDLSGQVNPITLFPTGAVPSAASLAARTAMAAAGWVFTVG